MKNKFKSNFFLFILAVFITFVIYSCKDDTVTSTQTTYDPFSVNGTVTFADNNFGSSSVGYYDVAAFTSWPPTGPPSADDSMVITQSGNQFKSNYKIIVPSSGTYYIAVGWRRLTGGASPVLGILGCDTMHYMPPNQTCPLDTSQMGKVNINSNGTGVGNINFLSWADTNKRIF
jgi:hypothetical protein